MGKCCYTWCNSEALYVPKIAWALDGGPVVRLFVLYSTNVGVDYGIRYIHDGQGKNNDEPEEERTCSNNSSSSRVAREERI